jgi:hypothetical protein
MSEIYQYHISARPRHLRYLFFIGENFTGAELRELMVRNLEIWGGRYNPIIPVVANQISDKYKNVVNHFDPDIVFYSSSVDIEQIKKLFFFNPAKFININDTFEFRMEGVSSSCFLNEIEKNRPLAATIGDIPAVLKDFYSLNFLVSNETFKIKSSNDTDSFNVDMGSYTSINDYIFKKKAQPRSSLSLLKLNTVILRHENLSSDNFELIISNEKDSLPDLFYFWNRQLFVTNSNQNQIILSKIELEELLKDKTFEGVLYNLAQKNIIDVTSFSLLEPELKSIVSEQIQPFSKYIRFYSKKYSQFPFDVLDANGLFKRDYGEVFNKQVFLGNKGLFYFPSLSFSNSQPLRGKWAVDIEIERIGEYQKHTMKFSTRVEHLYFLNANGRVNKRRNLSLFADSSNTSIELKIPEFNDSIRQIISAPKFFEKKCESKYKVVRISHDGSKLLALINLFNGNLDAMHSILYDKFWFDLIVDLSSNTRIAGDTICFKDIKTCCIKIMDTEGIVLSPDSHQSEKNLEKGIQYALDEFCEKGIFFIGFNIKCSTCSSKFWYSLNETQDLYSCKGCGKKHRFPIEEQFSYKLNDLVKNNFCNRDATGRFKPDGNITVMKSIINLSGGEGSMSFEYSPQLNIYPDYNSGTLPITDIDIIGLSNGKLVIGEAKHSSGAFSEEGNKPLNNLIEIAKAIHPDKVVITCSEDSHDKLQKKKEYLIHHLKDLPIEVDAFKVTEPFYNFRSHLYFYD